MAKLDSSKVRVDREGGPDLPPWPEWSDSFIRTATWNVSRPTKSSISHSGSLARIRTEWWDEQVEREVLYEDPAGLVEMPENIPVTSWVRPHQIPMSSSSSFVVEPDDLPLDLLAHNRHLMKYKIMRMIVGAVACVEREAFYRPFPVEFQSPQFVAPGASLWRPWHHVYCVGPQTHNLQYNRCGKYLVRLFYMGKWRRLTVDDQLPVDSEGQLLLPISRSNNLWLPILSKALLRVAALSKGADFSVIHCLTAWIPTKLYCKDCSQYQLWRVCCQLMATTHDITHPPGCCHSQLSVHCPPDASVENLDAVGSRVIFGVISHPEKAVSARGDESLVLVSSIRYNNERPSPQWKEYRWKEWALNNGIISDITTMPFRNIQIFYPLGLLDILPHGEVEKSVETSGECWMNFETFISATRTLEVYYKPSYFKYSLKAWSLSELTHNTQCAEDVLFRNRGRDTVKRVGGKGDAKSKSKSKSPKANKSDNSLAVTALKSQESKKTKGAKQTGAKNKQTSFIEWPLSSNTSFFYLLVDSMFCKQVYICLSACDPEKPTSAHLSAGKFEWHSTAMAPLVFVLTTSATTGYTLALSPGRHVFRVWYQFPVHFCLQIYSNTMFTLGSKMYIHQMLSHDSESFQFYGDRISSEFERLLNATDGGAEHGRAYNQLVTSLHPPQLREQLVWPHWLTARIDLLQAFEETLTEMLVESTQSSAEVHQVLQTFQMLFLNPVFGEKTLSKVRSDHYDFIQQQRYTQHQRDMLTEEELKRKVVETGNTKLKIKSTKPDKTKKTTKESPKKESVKSAKTGKAGKQKMDKSKGKAVGKEEQLRKLLRCKEKSLYLGDKNQVIIMLKKMMTKVLHLKKLYPFRYEDDYSLVFHDYVGEVQVSDNWVVLVWCVVNLHSSEAVPCSLHVWSPLQNILLRLINNDTQQDVPLSFIENNVARLSKTVEGYTLCVYGTTDVQTVPWRLRSVGVSETDSLHVCLFPECPYTRTQLPELSQQTLHGFYVPNKDSLITRCLLDIYTDVTVMLRLSLSSDSAVFSFTVLDESDSPVLVARGVGHIVIPVLRLNGKESVRGSYGQQPGTSSTKRSVYTVEVKLLHNSWSLGLDQRKAMIFYKEHLADMQLNPQVDNYEREHLSDRTSAKNLDLSERTSAKNLDLNFFENVDKPSWSLTLVTDLQKGVSVSLREDLTLFDQLRELVSLWEEEGQNLSLCQQLRQDFLNQIKGAEEDVAQEIMFHPKANKTADVTQLYGRRSSRLLSESVPSHLRDGSGLSEITEESEDTLGSQLSSSQPSQSTSLVLGAQQVERPSSDEKSQVNHRDILVQQAGIHQALTDMRTRNMERNQEVFEETALLRTRLIAEIKAAKEAESKKEKTKSRNSQDESPVKSKEKGSKKSKPKKGKGTT